MLFELFHNHLIICRIDKTVVALLVASYAHFRVDIVLETVVVSIEMVGGDIHQNGDICPKIEHTVELETAQLEHIPVVLFCCHAIGKRLANITT